MGVPSMFAPALSQLSFQSQPEQLLTLSLPESPASALCLSHSQEGWIHLSFGRLRVLMEKLVESLFDLLLSCILALHCLRPGPGSSAVHTHSIHSQLKNKIYLKNVSSSSLCLQAGLSQEGYTPPVFGFPLVNPLVNFPCWPSNRDPIQPQSSMVGKGLPHPPGSEPLLLGSPQIGCQACFITGPECSGPTPSSTTSYQCSPLLQLYLTLLQGGEILILH